MKQLINISEWMARTDKPRSELESSIIIYVKHYIGKVKTDSQENL